MMSLEEACGLPIPEKNRNCPNIYRLACILESTGRAMEILSALEVILPSMVTADKEGAA